MERVTLAKSAYFGKQFMAALTPFFEIRRPALGPATAREDEVADLQIGNRAAV